MDWLWVAHSAQEEGGGQDGIQDIYNGGLISDASLPAAFPKVEAKRFSLLKRGLGST